MVAASFSTLSGLYWPTWRFLEIPVGLLVTEQFSRVTGFQAHGPQDRSLSPSSTRTFSLLSWQPTSGVPLWAFKRVNFLSDNRSVVEILRSDASRAPAIMSLVRYLSLLERLRFTFTPNGKREFVPRDQVFPSFSFNDYFFYTKISSFMPVLSIQILLAFFYQLILYSEKFSTWIWRLPFAVNVNLNLSIDS